MREERVMIAYWMYISDCCTMSSRDLTFGCIEIDLVLSINKNLKIISTLLSRDNFSREV